MTIDPHAQTATIGPAFLLVGSGTALTVPALMAAALAGMPAERAGIGSGVHNAARQVGAALGVALFESLVGRPGADFMSGLHLAILISIAFLCSAFVITHVSIPKMEL